MLWWRHHAQAETARETEGRQETHEASRACGSPAGSVPDRAEELMVDDRKAEFQAANVRVPVPGTPETDGQTATGTVSKRPRKSLIREYGEAIFIAVLLALVIRTLVVQAFTIPSGSMMDTLLVGDYILVNKFLYGPELPFTDAHMPGLRDPRHGDIIVFKYPQDEKRDFIKRIIAGPGETVQVRGNQVFVDGHALREPYTKRVETPLPQGAQTYCGYAYACEPT